MVENAEPIQKSRHCSFWSFARVGYILFTFNPKSDLVMSVNNNEGPLCPHQSCTTLEVTFTNISTMKYQLNIIMNNIYN